MGLPPLPPPSVQFPKVLLTLYEALGYLQHPTSIGHTDRGSDPPPSAPIQALRGSDLLRMRSFRVIWSFLRRISDQIRGVSLGERRLLFFVFIFSLFLSISFNGDFMFHAWNFLYPYVGIVLLYLGEILPNSYG